MPILIVGLIYGLIEYIVALDTDTPEAFWPLVARVFSVAMPLGTSIGLFEIGFKSHFSQRSFLYLVLIKTTVYTIILSFWLLIVNGIYQLIVSERSL